MRILILNWRDIRNPLGGGAEILTHELAKRWVKNGHKVTQLSSKFRGSLKEEVIDGVRIIRMGAWWSIHGFAFFYYSMNLRGKVDAVIDEVHFFPFFAALYVREKTVLLACEVANKLFFKLFPYPLAFIGRSIEKLYLMLYKNIPVLAISPSTKRALVAEGFRENNITILPMGITLPETFPKFGKEKDPTMIFVGRLSKVKGVEDAILACRELKGDFPNIKLWVIGRGSVDYEKQIKRMVSNLSLEKEIKFLGFVSQVKKFEMMQRAHLLLAPSFQEGFGLTIPEAGYVGVPSVVYRSLGLSDIVIDGENGLICNENTPESLSKTITLLLQNPTLYKKLSDGARRESAGYDWNKTARIALKIISD